MTVSQQNKKRSTESARSANTKRSGKSTTTKIGGKRTAAKKPISVRFKDVRSGFSLTQPVMARVLGISARKLSELETSARQPRPETKRRLTETVRLYKALAEIMDVSDLPEWMEEPNEAFDGATPLQLIERGEIDRLWQMVYAVRSGHPM